MELAQYTIKPNIVRIVAAKILYLLLLGILMYFAVWLNLYLLQITVPPGINLLIIMIILAILLLQIAITYIKFSKTKYFFFPDRIEYKGKKPKIFYFASTQRIYIKRGIADKILKTGNIIIEPDFQIKFVSNVKQVYTYTQALIQRIKGYNRQYGQDKFKQ